MTQPPAPIPPTTPATPDKAAIVMSFDRRMFPQATRCIDTIAAHCPDPYELCVLALDLEPSQLAWLGERGARVRADHSVVRTYPDAPVYAHAMTCRPYLPDLFPGYAAYMWVDADVRFARPDAFAFYLGNARAHPAAITICQEVDPCYRFVREPAVARLYFDRRYERLLRTYGQQAAEYFRYTYGFNAGVFAMHRDSPVWSAYRRNLERATSLGFDHLAEQDALNVAMAECGWPAIVAPTSMNWLCSISLPRRDASTGRWVRPEYPHLPIAVLHLTNSFETVSVDGQEITFYEFFERLGFA